MLKNGFIKYGNGVTHRIDIYGEYDMCDDTWEEYKEPILDEAEKEYLENIVKPYRDRVGFIVKTEADVCERIIICVLGLTQHNNYIVLPYFYKNTMYKGMEVGKDYTLEELGL